MDQPQKIKTAETDISTTKSPTTIIVPLHHEQQKQASEPQVDPKEES